MRRRLRRSALLRRALLLFSSHFYYVLFLTIPRYSNFPIIIRCFLNQFFLNMMDIVVECVNCGPLYHGSIVRLKSNAAIIRSH